MLTLLKQQIAQKLSEIIAVDSDKILSLLEVPKDLTHGHLALPVFFLAKEWKKAPNAIAEELVGKFSLTGVSRVIAVGGYLNFSFEDKYLQQILADAVFNNKKEVGFNNQGTSRKIIIDYSSPNVAKQMSIGHLRATVIGQAICGIALTQGYEVIKLNHLGDWGSQFGKLAWAILEWKEEYNFKEKPIESLTKIYVRFHEEAERNPELNEKGAAMFKRLETGDPEVVKIWQWIVDLSMQDYNRLWQRLGVAHDLVCGESFYNDRLKPTEKCLEDKGLLVESDGAMVVQLEGEKPPCLIRKADGASLYATRDIASAIYRMEELKADINLYVVGMDQKLHFEQVFEVLRKMNYPWANDCHHVSFGMYRFKDMGRMSTRKGTVIYLEDVLNKSVAMVKSVIESKNPDLPNKDIVAEQVGVGAVIFNDLINDRVKDVDFDWDKVVNFDGDSGPYVQYCQVRCRSLIKKYAKKVDEKFSEVLDSHEERELVRLLLCYDDALTGAFRIYKPHILASYLLDVCRSFNHFYHKHRIIGEEEGIESSRMTLVYATMIILQQGLKVLNIQSPEAM